MNTRIALAVAAVLSTLATASTGFSSDVETGRRFGAGPTCARATQEVQREAANLSRATRDADARAAEYHGCMKRSRNDGRACAAQSRALRDARVSQQSARKGYAFAVARQKHACRR